MENKVEVIVYYGNNNDTQSIIVNKGTTRDEIKSLLDKMFKNWYSFDIIDYIERTPVQWLIYELGFILQPYFTNTSIINLCDKALEMEKKMNHSQFEKGYLKCADDLKHILEKGIEYNEIKNKLLKYEKISISKKNY